jgi:hypothetical protein
MITPDSLHGFILLSPHNGHGISFFFCFREEVCPVQGQAAFPLMVVEVQLQGDILAEGSSEGHTGQSPGLRLLLTRIRDWSWGEEAERVKFPALGLPSQKVVGTWI